MQYCISSFLDIHLVSLRAGRFGCTISTCFQFRHPVAADVGFLHFVFAPVGVTRRVHSISGREIARLRTPFSYGKCCFAINTRGGMLLFTCVFFVFTCCSQGFATEIQWFAWKCVGFVVCKSKGLCLALLCSASIPLAGRAAATCLHTLWVLFT